MLHFDDLAQSVHVRREPVSLNETAPSHPGQPTLSRTDCRLDAMLLLSQPVVVIPRWDWGQDEISGCDLEMAGDWGQTLAVTIPLSAFFFYVINTVDTLDAATWWHTNTATMSMCVYDIMVSGTITFKVCKKKKKYNLPKKKITLTKWKRCYKVNVQYSGIKIVWVISVLKKVLKNREQCWDSAWIAICVTTTWYAGLVLSKMSWIISELRISWFQPSKPISREKLQSKASLLVS